MLRSLKYFVSSLAVTLVFLLPAVFVDAQLGYINAGTWWVSGYYASLVINSLVFKRYLA